GCQTKRNGSTRQNEMTSANSRGEIMTAAAISRILPIETPFLPGAIAKSMTVIRKVRRSARSRLAPVHLESKTWPEMSGNGVSIITSFIARDRKRTRADRPPAASACIVAAVGNRASAVYGQRRAVRTCPVLGVTISASGSFVSATKCRDWCPYWQKESRRQRRLSKDVNV